MTVTIDPSEIRSQTSGARTSPATSAPRRPLRMLLLGGIGGAGLLAFTVGAFSFFSGLADPRVRHTRPIPVAANMPDLKDGLPALAGESAPQPAALNLPKPPSEPVAASQEKTDLALRTQAPSDVAADATGSVSERAADRPAKAVPPIENAATVIADAKPAPIIAPPRTAGPLAPAKAETVRAKEAQPRAFAALPAEASKPERAKPQATSLAPVKRKPTLARTAAAKPAVEASAESAVEAAPLPVARAVPEEPELMGVKIPGGRQIREGINAVFGGTDEN